MLKKGMKNINLSKNKLLNRLNNKIFLYILSILAFLFLMQKILDKKHLDIIIFLVLSILIFVVFTKNMIYVLGISLLVSYLFSMLKKSNKEGLKPSIKKNRKNRDMEDERYEDEDEYEEEELDMDDNEDEYENEDEDETTEELTQLKPALIDNIPSKKKMKSLNTKQDQMEAAYNNLDNIIGTKNVRSMTSNTKDLMSKQKELMNGLKDITPVLDQAVNIMNKFDFSKLGLTQN